MIRLLVEELLLLELFLFFLFLCLGRSRGARGGVGLLSK